MSDVTSSSLRVLFDEVGQGLQVVRKVLRLLKSGEEFILLVCLGLISLDLVFLLLLLNVDLFDAVFLLHTNSFVLSFPVVFLALLRSVVEQILGEMLLWFLRFSFESLCESLR